MEVSPNDYDFCGWATKNNIRCTDGLVIAQNAFADNDGGDVPLIWMHDHSDPTNTLGNVYLENKPDGLYAYGKFNNSDKARAAKESVMHGDITMMSIFAGGVRKQGNVVMHGDIKEVSLVVAAANPGARIESVIAHSDEGNDWEECELTYICPEGIGFIEHSDDFDDGIVTGDDHVEHKDPDNKTWADILKTMTEEQLDAVGYVISQAFEIGKGYGIGDAQKDTTVAHSAEGSATIGDIIKTMDPDQIGATKQLIARAIEDTIQNGGNNVMHNIFENDNEIYEGACISHADQGAIITAARSSASGSFMEALHQYIDEHYQNEDGTISHAFEDVTQLFPDWHDEMPGAPEIIPEDTEWVKAVMNGVKKSPFSRLRTRQADISEIKAQGYDKTKNGGKKKNIGNIKLVTRTTVPQTVYIKDELHRDDVVDVTDFDYITYENGIMNARLRELIARAILIGDGVDDMSDDKIHEENIRSILNDDDMYTIHTVVDFDAAKAKINGTNTAANFGEAYYRTEAIIEASLFAREDYKGASTPVGFFAPHTINEMLTSRDMNGRRIYENLSQLKTALNLSAIHTVEPMNTVTRTDKETREERKPLAIMLNLSDYVVGSTKKGQLASFNDFDLNFNKMLFMIETRLCGTLERVKSAIVLEEKVSLPASENV